MLLYRRLLHALDNHGLRGLILRALRKLTRQAEPGPPFHELAMPHPFDQRHATDTSGHIPGEQLTPSNLYNTAYYAISPSTLTDALERIPQPLPGFTFVDLGCGKGRALLVAAAFPFSRILGVELAPELCAIARTNGKSDLRIAVLQQDAATFTYPDAPLVVFLYHPFLKLVLRRCLANLERQRRHCPHPTYLLYANCRYEKVMTKFPFLEIVWDWNLPLSPADAAADRHHITHERFTLYRAATEADFAFALATHAQ
jgi:SAM-dependent methyltransferase